jgi:hypothetical protein
MNWHNSEVTMILRRVNVFAPLMTSHQATQGIEPAEWGIVMIIKLSRSQHTNDDSATNKATHPLWRLGFSAKCWQKQVSTEAITPMDLQNEVKRKYSLDLKREVEVLTTLFEEFKDNVQFPDSKMVWSKQLG